MTTNDKEQNPCMQAEPQMEHRWLEKLAGNWTYEAIAVMEPGKPAALPLRAEPAPV